MASTFNLLTQNRFLPLFVTQFLGAFNDNLFKNALIVLITYFLADQLTLEPQGLVTLTGCLLIAPMFFFSAIAGTIADKFEKAKLIKIYKFIEIALMMIGAIGFVLQNIYCLMIVLFLLGTQATFFGPLKYSILPFHLDNKELVSGNALIEMGTFLAILLGNILGALFVSNEHGLIVVSIIIIAMAILGYISSSYIPQAKAIAPNLPISYNFLKETWKIVNASRQTPRIFLCILGISWFWLVGFIFLAEFPNFTKYCIGGNQQVFALFLTIFSVGVGLGSLTCNWLLKGRIEATYVPLAALGLSLFTIDLYFSTRHFVHTEDALLLSLTEFLSYRQHWRIMIDMLYIAVCAGNYIVPLYTIMQHEAADEQKARVIASNNILNALFMMIAAAVVMILIKLNFSIPQIFLIVGLVNLLVMIQSCRLLPGALLKSICRLTFQALYKVEVKGLENFSLAGERVVITPNHTSFLDGLLLAAFLPGNISFAMHSDYANKWWLKPLRLFAEIFSVDQTNPYIMKSMVKYVKEDKKLVIFPEGRITVTGSLMKTYEGPGMIADKANATILPILIAGAQHTPFSRVKDQVATRWFPKITLTIYPPRQYEIDPSFSTRERRQFIGEKLYQTMSDMVFLGADLDCTLFQSLLMAKKTHGRHFKVVEDINRQPLTYSQLITRSVILGQKIATMTAKGEAVGVLLPNVSANVVTLFGLQAFGRVAALLNFTTGVKNVVFACQTAQIKLVCTSRTFIEKTKLHPIIAALEELHIQILYLEDLKTQITLFDKLLGMLKASFPRLAGLWPKPQQSDQPAIILFTSGSEGTPKAVVLSSRNIQANRNQLASRVDFTRQDIVLNALPLFHSFGLTAGTLLPVLSGMKVFLYPSPLHYRVIPEISYNINATILFGTNTFLTNYAKYAHPYDFYSIRYVYAGAEKLKAETRQMWADKFGLRIFEGYGATEAAPVIAANTPMRHKPGTVGQLMPGIEYQLQPVPGVTIGGRLIIKGPNVMLGYMFHEQPGVLNPPAQGWYDTGDIVVIDREGYIKIEGRAKRFAKIGGEMVSLAYVENYLDQLWPQAMHAVVAQPDQKKGEQLVLITTQSNADKSEILRYTREDGINELFVPKIILVVEKLPLLGSGKIDYSAINEMLR